MSTAQVERKITLVVSGTYREFLDWCKTNKRSPYDRYLRYAAFSSSVKLLLPQDICRVVFVGSYHARPDINDIREQLRVMGITEEQIGVA